MKFLVASKFELQLTIPYPDQRRDHARKACWRYRASRGAIDRFFSLRAGPSVISTCLAVSARLAWSVCLNCADLANLFDFFSCSLAFHCLRGDMSSSRRTRSSTYSDNPQCCIVCDCIQRMGTSAIQVQRTNLQRQIEAFDDLRKRGQELDEGQTQRRRHVKSLLACLDSLWQTDMFVPLSRTGFVRTDEASVRRALCGSPSNPKGPCHACVKFGAPCIVNIATLINPCYVMREREYESNDPEASEM